MKSPKASSRPRGVNKPATPKALAPKTAPLAPPDTGVDYDPDEGQIIEPVSFDFGLKRRAFVQIVASGLLIAAAPLEVSAQSRGKRSGGGFGGAPSRNVNERIHIGKDGLVTLLVGKVEVGQGSRAEYTQAAAEELRISASAVQVTMSDTALTPNDGNTAGSGSTPRTVPAIRQAAAAAREVLIDLASQRWSVDRATVQLHEGKVTHAASQRTMTFGELAQGDDLPKALGQPLAAQPVLTSANDWKVMGTSVARPNASDLVTGSHRYSSDIKRPGMLRGKILRPPSYGAKLTAIDVAPAQAMKDVIVVRDGDFVGVAAPTTHQAREALDALAKTAKWDAPGHPASKDIYNYLRQHVGGGVPKSAFAAELAAAKKSLRATYNVAYVQHAPMETRGAVAEWEEGKLTVWTGTQNPFGYRGELARALRVSEDAVRVIVPDTGGGFGGKHTGEAAIEAARLAQAARKPVCLKWTREEEFTWASFRPAAVMDAEASLDENGHLTSWHFINVNAGGSAVESPYRCAKASSRAVNSQPPLRHGSYRALASTANNFARESFIDELAAAAEADPLEFRLAHLDKGRLRDVLEEAAKRFKWTERVKRKDPNRGVGLACGTEKGSYVAACVEVEIDRKTKRFIPREVCQVFECGAVINPGNLRAQAEGAIMMGLGPALREAMRFENGKMLNTNFSSYEVPRFKDMPQIEVHLLNRKDLASAGGGETPIIAVAPAIGNAIFHASSVRLREMPMRWPDDFPS